MTGRIKNCTAVLFDLDGTLLDTLEDIAVSMNIVLAHSGYPQHPIERYRHFVGAGLVDLARRALPPDAGAETAARLADAMRAEYSHRWAHATRPYAGVAAMLDGLSGAGIRFSVLSNKPDNFTVMLCDRFLSDWNFEIVRGAVESVPKKPDPSAALLIASDMGIDPAHFACLGDTGSDMTMAIAAGMYPAGALWGFRDADELAAAGALTLLARPEDFLGLFGIKIRVSE